MDSWGKSKKKMERQIQGEHLAKAHGVYEGNVQGFHPPQPCSPNIVGKYIHWYNPAPDPRTEWLCL